jgi:hypothetical protein
MSSIFFRNPFRASERHLVVSLTAGSSDYSVAMGGLGLERNERMKTVKLSGIFIDRIAFPANLSAGGDSYCQPRGLSETIEAFIENSAQKPKRTNQKRICLSTLYISYERNTSY